MSNRWIDTQAVAFFLSIVQTKSIKNTASEFGVTPSAVSQKIHALEEYLGVELLDRQTRPMQLTAMGRLFQVRAKEFYEKANEISKIVFLSHDKFASLRIGLSASISATIAPWLVPRLHERVENLTIQTGMTEFLYEELRLGHLDLLVVPDHLSFSEMYPSVPLYEESLWVVTNAHCPTIHTVSDLASLAQTSSLITYNNMSCNQQIMDRFLRIHHLHVRRSLQLESSRTVLGYIAHHQGWSLLAPSNIYSGREYWSQIKIHRLDNAWLKRTHSILYRSDHYDEFAYWLKGCIQHLMEKHIVESWRSAFKKQLKPKDQFCCWV